MPTRRKTTFTDAERDPQKVRAGLRVLSWLDAIEAGLPDIPVLMLQAIYEECAKPPVPGYVIRHVEQRRHEIRKLVGARIETLTARRKAAESRMYRQDAVDAVLAVAAIAEMKPHKAQHILRQIKREYLDLYYERHRAAELDGCTDTPENRKWWSRFDNPPKLGVGWPAGTIPGYDPRAGEEMMPAPDRPEDDTPASREMEALRRARGAM